MNMGPARTNMGALMAKHKDNGTKKIGVTIAGASVILAFLIAFAGIIIYASETRGCAERAHVRINSNEKNFDDFRTEQRIIQRTISEDVKDIKKFLIEKPK